MRCKGGPRKKATKVLKEVDLETNDYPVEEILKEARCFMVPLYQRKFQWGDDRLGPFWEDVEAKAGEVLEGRSKFQHYMGALILSPIGEAAQIGVTPRVQVVDGQQRLTTFQLLLATIREVARKNECANIIESVEDYLFNPLKSKDTDPLTRFKLIPTPSDREIFHDILQKEYSMVRVKYGNFYWGAGVPKNTPWRSLRAYDEFKKCVEKFVRYGPSDTEAAEEEDHAQSEVNSETVEHRLEAILKAVLNRMKLVVITLGDGDDAQVIFETLNSKGEPLLAMDLVRNNIFHRAEKEKASIEAIYKELWDPFDASWWREPAPNSRPKRPRIDHFLAHVLAAETGENISMRELYAEYRAFAVPKGTPRFPRVEDELRLLEKYVPIYETLEGQADADPSIAWLGRKLAAWQNTTAYPILLQAASANLSDEELKTIVRLIYSYIVRRAICGLTAKSLNRVFQSLAQLFLGVGPSVEALSDFFNTREGDSIRFPGDDEFKRGILTNPAYSLAPGPRIRDVLWELELSSRPQFAERTEMPSGLWTEHMLPVTWTEEWPFPDGETIDHSSDDPRAAERKRILHTLGNLTLITDSLNISSGNKSFAEKKEKLAENTGLFLNKWFAKKEEWNELHIKERGEELADKALGIWVALPSKETTDQTRRD